MSLLCVGTGLVPDPNAQKILSRAAIGSSTTIRLLLNVLIHSNSDIVSGTISLVPDIDDMIGPLYLSSD